MNMTKELKQLEYADTLVELNSLFEQYGVRHVMSNFRDSFPQMYQELLVQLPRIPPIKDIPALLR